jgi:hypothetical protein
MRTLILRALLAALCLMLAAGCARQSRTEERTSPTGRGSVTVAPFTQPTDISQLILGALPENQGRIPQDMLASLDREFRAVLGTQGKSTFTYPARLNLPKNDMQYHTSDQPQALPLWVNYGKRMNASLLLIPFVLNWHEREGSAAGVTSSAHVRIECFLLDVTLERIVGRSIFDEKQVGLTENLLSVGSFLKRRGTWVPATELAVEAMRKAVQDLSL